MIGSSAKFFATLGWRSDSGHRPRRGWTCQSVDRPAAPAQRSREYGVDRLTGAFVGVGGVGNTTLRQRLYEQTRSIGFAMLSIIHPGAIIAASAVLESGVMIMAGAIINPAAHLGDNVIINTEAIVDHDGQIGAQAHVDLASVV